MALPREPRQKMINIMYLVLTAILALNSCPERLGEQEMNRRHHLVSQLAHPKGDDGRVEVDVGRGAENLTQATLDPAPQDNRGARIARQAICHVAHQWLGYVPISLADREFDDGAVRLVETSANARA